MRVWSNKCGDDFEYWNAEVVEDDQMHNFKLRINLPHDQYLRARDCIASWLHANCPSWVFSFKTLVKGVELQSLPRRFRGAGQFTIYLKQGADINEVKQFCLAIEGYIQGIIVPNDETRQRVMASDYAITEHVSSRYERLAWLENAYMSERMLQSRYFKQLYDNALLESEFYLQTYRTRHRRLPYDPDLEAMMNAGLGYAAQTAPRISGRQDGWLCQDIALICRGMLQNPSYDLLPLATAVQTLMKPSTDPDKLCVQRHMCVCVNGYFKRHFNIDAMSKRLLDTDLVALQAKEYVEQLSLFKSRLAGAGVSDKKRIAKCWLEKLNRCTKDRFSFFGLWHSGSYHKFKAAILYMQVQCANGSVQSLDTLLLSTLKTLMRETRCSAKAMTWVNRSIEQFEQHERTQSVR